MAMMIRPVPAAFSAENGSLYKIMPAMKVMAMVEPMASGYAVESGICFRIFIQRNVAAAYSTNANRNFHSLIAASAPLIGLSAGRRFKEAALNSSWPLAIMMTDKTISMDHLQTSKL